MIRILSSRTALVDNKGVIMPDWFTFLTDWVKQFNKRSVAYSTSATSVTGSTALTEAYSANCTPGNTGSVRMVINTTSTSNANAKTVIVKAGSVTIATIAISNNTAFQSCSLMITGRAANSQYMAVTGLLNCTVSPAALTFDMSGAVTFTVSLQLANSADTVALQSFSLDVESA